MLMTAELNRIQIIRKNIHVLQQKKMVELDDLRLELYLLEKEDQRLLKDTEGYYDTYST